MQRGKLVTERLAGASRHDRHGVAAVNDGLDDVLLAWTELGNPERAPHEAFDGGKLTGHARPSATAVPASERAVANEPGERSAPAKRRAREPVGESEGRSPSNN